MQLVKVSKKFTSIPDLNKITTYQKIGSSTYHPAISTTYPSTSCYPPPSISFLQSSLCRSGKDGGSLQMFPSDDVKSIHKTLTVIFFTHTLTPPNALFCCKTCNLETETFGFEVLLHIFMVLLIRLIFFWIIQSIYFLTIIYLRGIFHKKTGSYLSSRRYSLHRRRPDREDKIPHSLYFRGRALPRNKQRNVPRAPIKSECQHHADEMVVSKT